MEPNSEEVKSNDDFRASFKYLTREEIEALSKEELAQYIEGYKEYSRQFSIRIEQSNKEFYEMQNEALEANKLKYPNSKYTKIKSISKKPLSQEEIDAILGPTSDELKQILEE